MAKEKNNLLDSLVEMSTSLLIGYAITRFVKIAMARGESMLPTIKHNQPMIVDCKAYKRRQPKRHDLIAFKSHQKKGHKIFLKRVIGLPGETILIEKGQVFINNLPLDEPYLNESMRVTRKLELTIKEETLFVMGDNRNHSLDSRSNALGLVSINDVVGVIKKFK